MRDDDKIVETVDQWKQKEYDNEARRIGLAHERAEKRWADFKTGVLWIFMVVFFPITILVFTFRFFKNWFEETYDPATPVIVIIAIVAAIIFGGMGIHWVVAPSTEEQFATCNSSWETSSCLALLHACPQERKSTLTSCQEACPCKVQEIFQCAVQDEVCIETCSKTFDEEDVTLAQCSTHMDLAICSELFQHCGPLGK